MEACATARHWARELIALGHQGKLMPPAYVKAYVKRNKNDAADAEAICEAVARPSIRFAPVKDAEQQSVLILHRARGLLVRQRVVDSSLFRSGREFAARLGMTPRQNSSGGRTAWVGPASAATNTSAAYSPQAPLPYCAMREITRPLDGGWVRSLLARKPTKVAAVAPPASSGQ